MHAIDPLITGFADAAGGYAMLYRRGTSTAATAYSDFAGQYAVNTHTLDAAGRCVRYVNELVDVKVYDEDGTQVVDTFTAGSNATALEIIDAHSTGTDYDTAASGANKPTTLQSQLGARYTSFGAKDFKVLVGGQERNLKDVLLTGLIDVTGPTYNAAGDGVTDDTTVVQAAITAADAFGGGIVFFPPGTYKVSTLTIPSNVTLLGCGSGKSILTTSYASDCLLVGSGQFYAQGLKFQTTAYGLLRWTVAVGNGTVFTGCCFALTSAATKTLENVTGSLGFGGFINLTTFIGCEFIQTGTGGTLPFINNGANVHGGAITYVSGKAFGGDYMSLTGVYIEYQGAGAGNLRAFASSTYQVLTGCNVVSAGGALALNPGIDLIETGCFMSGTRDSVSLFNQVRESTASESSGSATSVTPTPLTAKRFMVVSTGASFQVNNATGASTFVGYDLIVFYKNTSGGAITPTLDTMYKGATPSVANNSAVCWHFTWSSTLSKFVQVGDVAAYAS